MAVFHILSRIGFTIFLNTVCTLYYAQHNVRKRNIKNRETDVRQIFVKPGIPCAACTILLSISSQLAQIYNETTVESLERLCTFLPETYKGEKS